MLTHKFVHNPIPSLTLPSSSYVAPCSMRGKKHMLTLVVVTVVAVCEYPYS